MTKREKTGLKARSLNKILMMSAWSFIIVLSSFLFLFVGRWIDVAFHTEPAFMLGLFIMGICLCVARMYAESVKTGNRLRNLGSRT